MSGTAGNPNGFPDDALEKSHETKTCPICKQEHYDVPTHITEAHA